MHGDPNTEIKTIIVGIDMEIGELLLADHLSKNGRKVDLVLAHHPEGVGLAGLDDVMHMQTDMLENLGIEPKVAKALMGKRIGKVARSLHSANHTRMVDAARLLDIPYMCCHTPADNHVAGYLQKLVDTKKPKTLSAMIDLLMREPEYKVGAREKAGPKILIGKGKDKPGKTVVDMTGGTEGSDEIFARIHQAGIQTVLGMHFSEAHYNKMRAEHVSVVNAGHIASDNLGMNLLIDKLVKKDKIEIIECSGFRRFKR